MTGPALPDPVHAAPLPPSVITSYGATVLTAVPYAQVPGFRPLELDLVRPAVTAGPVPLVVFLHGGGWRTGHRRSVGPAYTGSRPTPFDRIADRGIAVASIDYRLSGEATFPAPLHDAKAAVRFLRARAGELGVDPERIAVWGVSAGGHLAALVGLTADGDPALEGEVGVVGLSSAVRAVVAWYAPADLPAIAPALGLDPGAPDSREALLLGAPLPAVPELAALAGPVTHVTPGAPPFLLLHGHDDRFVPVSQSEALHRALRAAGVEAELHVLDGADHLWRGSDTAPVRALGRTVDFLDGHLRAG